MGLNYKNHSGFLSCFVLHSIRLSDLVLLIKDADIRLASSNALLEPDFSQFRKNRAIVLKCFLENTRALNVGEKLRQADESMPFVAEGAPLLAGVLENIIFETIHAELIVCADRVHFSYFEGYSKNVRITASGIITERGDADVNIKAYFSPDMTKNLPEGFAEFLTNEANGWTSYSVAMESGKEKPYFKLESDRISINFERVESR